MFETLKEFWNVLWHRNVKITLFVIPIQCDTTVKRASPFFGTGVVFADGVDEMVSILFSNKLHSKIVNT